MKISTVNAKQVPVYFHESEKVDLWRDILEVAYDYEYSNRRKASEIIVNPRNYNEIKKMCIDNNFIPYPSEQKTEKLLGMDLIINNNLKDDEIMLTRIEKFNLPKDNRPLHIMKGII